MPEAGGGRALVLGCGGTLGFAWSVAALEAMEALVGWGPQEADVVVGTSAGAELAVLLAGGYGPAELLAALGGDGDALLTAHLAATPGALPPLPSPRPGAMGLVGAGLRRRVDRTAALAGLLPRGRGDAGWLRALADGVEQPGGWPDRPATWLVAAAARTGQRVAFGAPDAPPASLGDALAASWAVPGWFPPVQIAGREWVDGGVVSPTSADLLLTVRPEEVVVVAPMASRGGAPARGLSRVERILRRVMTARLDREQRLLERGGARVVRVEPGPRALAAMGPNFMNARRRAATIAAARAELPGRARPGRVRPALRGAGV